MGLVLGVWGSVLGHMLRFVVDPMAWLCILGGSFVGILFGAIPGITATTAVILMIPATYYMPLEYALLLLLATFKGGMFGGSISAVAIGTPGSPGAVATTFDGYPLGQQGKGIKAIRLALFSSFTGDLCSDLITVVLTPFVGLWVLGLGPPEIFVIVFASILLIGALSGPLSGVERPAATTAKAMLSGVFGVALILVGMEPIMGTARLTFGSPRLLAGFSLIPVFTGLFGVSRALALLTESRKASELRKAHLPPPKTPQDARLSLKEFLSCGRMIGFGTLLGTMVGFIPALGPNAAGLIAHAQGRILAKDKSHYGKGALEGVAVCESANSAVNGANMLPLVTLGIPGSTEAAVLLGAFILHGIQIGPLMVKHYPEVVYRMYGGMLLANVGMLVVGLPLTALFVRAVTIPRGVLMPIILSLCFMGIWLREPLVFHLWMLIIFGLIGFFMDKMGFSAAALTIGFVLGNLLEMSFNQSVIIARGNYLSLLTRPGLLSIVGLVVGGVATWLMVRRRAARP
ncbi:MAG: tripartite tricarboxylate transporter permease [Bacillota bacterium]|nr:tripartite tricarboxylate transporter permease [Bacillota bacterium]